MANNGLHRPSRHGMPMMMTINRLINSWALRTYCLGLFWLDYLGTMMMTINRLINSWALRTYCLGLFWLDYLGTMMINI